MAQRVLEGGHYVDPRTIKLLYQDNLKNINSYSNVFKVIELYDGMKIPTLLARMENDKIIMADEQALKKGWIKLGLPTIFKKISSYLKP